MTTHPVLEALQAAHAALDAATVRDEQGQTRGWLSLDGVDADVLNQVVRLHAELEGRVSGLRLHAVAAADASGAPEVAAAADTASWAATAGRNRSRRWGAVWLAKLLETKYEHTRAGLATGQISEEHAAIIVRAAEQIPSGVTPSELAECEEHLVEKAARMAPQNLRRAARRLLEPLSEKLADEHEDALLVQSEGRAEVETWFTMGDNGDGTWSGKFVIPELHGHILKARLEQLSSPRRHTRTKTGDPVEDVTVGNGLNYTEGLGAAFVEVLEHLPEHGHARSGITMVVHVDEEKLRAEVGAATIGTGAGTGPRLSNQECRRLLCEAGIMPMVMGGKSLPVDLGAASRLYTKAQIVALSALHDTCVAEGCDRPFAWCEMHHRRPWSSFGPTDLDNAAPLCGYHHRRVHDAHFEHRWLDDGTVQFRHRWRSRWVSGADPWARAGAAAAA